MTVRRADPRSLRAAVRGALEEDRFGHDVTTTALGVGRRRVTARVTAQGAGVLSGMAPAREVAKRAHLKVVRALRDGEPVRPGTEVLRVRGPARGVLGAERTLLNYLMHLSGVATTTARTVRAVSSVRPPVVILGTRKTTPGLRDLEKAAIVHGGGKPHRRDLQEAMLVKGNHLELLPLPQTLARLRRTAPGRGWVGTEVEVRTASEALRAARAGIRKLLIDNAGVGRSRAIVRRLERAGLRRALFIELSGGITPQNARSYARCGADALSLGSLTHSAPALPFHLEIVTSERPSL